MKPHRLPDRPFELVDGKVVLIGVKHTRTSGYRLGCRCDICETAEKTYAAARRPAPAEDFVTLADSEAPGDWVRLGKCRDVDDPSIFFPERGAPSQPAKDVCATCPVLNACREYAIASPATLVGVWGGTSHKQRRLIRAERRRAANLEQPIVTPNAA